VEMAIQAVVPNGCKVLRAGGRTDRPTYYAGTGQSPDGRRDRMGAFARPRVVVSRCLGFESCRWNGALVPDEFVESLKGFVEFSTLCPELEIGLGVPRNPVRIVSSGDSLRLVQQGTERDVTDEMLAYAGRALSDLGAVDGFILKSRSPSCGLKDTRIYPAMGKVAATRTGAGMFGAEVLRRFPLLAVEDEGRLKNDRIRDHFLKRIFTFSRFREMKPEAGMKDLVRLQAENKLLLLSYSQQEMRALGRIVANREDKPVEQIREEYEARLHAAMSRIPKDSANVNVLMHMLGFVSEGLSADERAFFLDTLEKYRLERVPLSVPISLMRAWAIRFDQAYLLQQSFLQPYPEELNPVLGKGVARELRP
jgi:uncharacterized protein YbgA (DUF1722 family)/uncharacterized protein YbbK (DUF523 family)